jgi:hypothetical protein
MARVINGKLLKASGRLGDVVFCMRYGKIVVILPLSDEILL